MLAAMATTDDLTPAGFYASTRRRLSALLGSLDEGELATRVPATPAWTVLDVARHLAGVAADVAEGRVEGAASDPWTAVQVRDRQERDLDEVLAEWEATAARVESLVEAGGRATFAIVIDAVTHEHDVRGAVGRPGARDEPAADWALQQLVAGVDASLRRRGSPPLRVRAGADEWRLGGEAEPAATLSAPPFELLRALIGRRSLAQLRAYGWEGDADAFVERLSVFPPTPDDIVE